MSATISRSFYIPATPVTISGALTTSANPPCTFLPPRHSEAQRWTQYVLLVDRHGQGGVPVATTEHLDLRVNIPLQNLNQPLLDGSESSSEQTSLHCGFYLSKTCSLYVMTRVGIKSF